MIIRASSIEDAVRIYEENKEKEQDLETSQQTSTESVKED